MTAKSFVDTNVVLYTIGKDARKADIARKLVGAQPAISTQVVNEKNPPSGPPDVGGLTMYVSARRA